MAQESVMGHINTKQEVIEAFQCFDKDNSGFLDVSILRQILSDLGDVMEEFEVEDLIAHADLQKSGKIDYKNFVTLMFMYDPGQ